MVMGQHSSVIHDLWFVVGLVLLGAGGAAVTIPTAALILGKAAIIGAGQDRTLLETYIRRELILVRGQSYVLRLPGGEGGVGGQYFGRRKTQLCTLPISNPLCIHQNFDSYERSLNCKPK
jgi:hypothetical protein